VNDCEDRLAVLPEKHAEWGICEVHFTKADRPVAKIRCMTCSKFDCPHISALVFLLPHAPDDDSPLALFKSCMENLPGKKAPYLPSNGESAMKIQLCPGQYY
jgi:hypothetical protein